MPSTTYDDDGWHSNFAQCIANGENMGPMGANAIFIEDAVPTNIHLGLDDANLYFDTFVSASSFPIDAAPDLRSGLPSDLDSHIFDCSSGPIQHYPTLNYNLSDPFPTEPLSTPPLAIPDSLLTPLPTPPPLAAASSCHEQNRPSCILTATQSLRSLHVQQINCHSRQNDTNLDGHLNGPGQPRMSGSVLKCNKDAGMSVCRMLQCPCALRPQNQLILAIICSKLIAWYRVMIHTCFVDPRVQNEARHNDTALEKVAHQPVTIGDHFVDDQGLGLTIQAQVMLKELQHMQRLVETLSARIQETASPFTSTSLDFGIETRSQSFKLPGLAHDQLIAHLLTEVHAAKADLSTASQKL